MRCVALVILGLAVAGANPIQDLDKELKEEGVDVKKVHELTAKLDKVVSKEEEDLDEKDKISKISAKIQALNNGKKVKEVEADPVTLNEKEGLTGDLFEGDLMLTNKQMEIIANCDSPAGNRSRRQALKDARMDWPKASNGLVNIPYRIHSTFPATRTQRLRDAMNYWNSATCVNFYQGQSEAAIVEVRNANGCSSMVGRTGSVQALNLAEGCMRLGITAHELSHTMGLLHVQSRADRDTHVAIDTTNIESNMMHNFNKETTQSTDTWDVPYEAGSNMHYAEGDFGIDRNRPVLVLRDQAKKGAYQKGLAGRVPTTYDVHQVNLHLGCYDNCKTKPACVNGFVDVKNCAKCRCATGWEGVTCNQRPAGTQTISVSSTTMSAMTSVPIGTGTAGTTYAKKNVLLQAPAGRRIQVQVLAQGTTWTNTCSDWGVEVKYLNDQKHSGAQLCDPRVNYAPITSEGNTIFMEMYTMGNRATIGYSYKLV